ncbi:hypothetical protein WAJ35_18865, partial [Acinetobacter baumannii]
QKSHEHQIIWCKSQILQLMNSL